MSEAQTLKARVLNEVRGMLWDVPAVAIDRVWLTSSTRVELARVALSVAGLHFSAELMFDGSLRLPNGVHLSGDQLRPLQVEARAKAIEALASLGAKHARATATDGCCVKSEGGSVIAFATHPISTKSTAAIPVERPRMSAAATPTLKERVSAEVRGGDWDIRG